MGRKGLVKLLNCATGNRGWNVDPLARESLEAGDSPWVNCKTGFSEDGKIGFAADRKGKVLAVRFLEA